MPRAAALRTATAAGGRDPCRGAVASVFRVWYKYVAFVALVSLLTHAMRLPGELLDGLFLWQ